MKMALALCTNSDVHVFSILYGRNYDFAQHQFHTKQFKEWKIIYSTNSFVYVCLPDDHIELYGTDFGHLDTTYLNLTLCLLTLQWK